MYSRVVFKGFTLIELLVVFAIVSIMATISVATFKSMHESTSLRAGVGEVFNALTLARGSTLASQNDQVYGVHISSTTVTRFEGGTYVVGGAGNVVYDFESGISATSTIITAGGTVTFSRLQGLPSTTGIIYVYDVDGAGTSTIIIHGSGLIEYN